jgi:multidrug resistance efflux pump
MSGFNTPILEDPDLNSSLNGLFSNASVISHTIYLIIICLLAFVSVGMAIVHIPVYIQSRGIIRPSAEVNLILAPVQGIIREINVSENQYVTKGYTIISLESEKESLQKKLAVNDLTNVRLWLQDLKKITAGKNGTLILLTDKYRIELILLTEQLEHIDLRLSMAKADFERFQKLKDKNFISEKEFEESALKYKSLQAEKNQLMSEKQKQWINELTELKIRESTLIRQISEINFFIERSIITAPVSGIIQGIRNQYTGGYCSAGASLCNLIPDTGLVAELFITPKDIGFLSPGQSVRLLIDSYDYKYWGALQSECTSISKDIEIIENQALFRVVCELQSNPFLEYRNKRVIPGKGMTLTAQFLVTEKNVWQLLRDEAYNLVTNE